MSGLYLIALIAVWFFVGWAIFHFWNLYKPKITAQRIVHIAIGAILLLTWIVGPIWVVAGKKAYWDSSLRKMCTQDGGINVFETVKLPPDEFDKWGMVLFYDPIKGEHALGPKYELKIKTIFLKEKKPAVVRRHYSIHRKEDGKSLGESVRYSRLGGDLPGFWHETSFSCPDNSSINNLIKSVFVETIEVKNK